jgi:heme O synthase-like polyprenyltransferase
MPEEVALRSPPQARVTERPGAHLALTKRAVPWWTFRRAPTPARAMRLFAYSITYLTMVLVGIGADTLMHAPRP